MSEAIQILLVIALLELIFIFGWILLHMVQLDSMLRSLRI